MKEKTTENPQDNEYFKELSKKHPHLKLFISCVPIRFQTPDGKTNCDSPLCIRRLAPEEINVFVTPAPEYNPLILCIDCLKFEYAKVAGTGQYDIHERHLPNKFKL
jgi:hypothetical protein